MVGAGKVRKCYNEVRPTLILCKLPYWKTRHIISRMINIHRMHVRVRQSHFCRIKHIFTIRCPKSFEFFNLLVTSIFIAEFLRRKIVTLIVQQILHKENILSSQAFQKIVWVQMNVVPRSTGNTNSGTRELTLKCKLKCYFKPMNNPLGVSPSKGKEGITRGKEKIFWPRWESNPRPTD